MEYLNFKIFSMVITTVAAITGGIFAYLNFKINKQKLITDRFSKAAEHLGSINNKIVVMEGINSLYEIAQDYPNHSWNVMRVLASFIRSKTLEHNINRSKNPENYPRVFSETQEAITVVTKINLKAKPSDEILDLSGSLFLRANLINASFRGVNLRDANFSITNLKGVDFADANLERAIFYESDLSNANLKGARLNEAIYCSKTKFPSNFDPVAERMKKE
jgi:Pentapeptide repeats (9 copies)